MAAVPVGVLLVTGVLKWAVDGIGSRWSVYSDTCMREKQEKIAED
jgi:hypothetical protein